MLSYTLRFMRAAGDGGEGGDDTTDDMSVKADDKSQKADDKSQKADDKSQKADDTNGGDVDDTVKKHTDKGVNDIVARNKTAWLKSLGFATMAEAKAAMTELKTLRDKGKTELERQQDLLKANEQAAAVAKADAELARGMVEAINLGVRAEKAERFVKIAVTYDGETIKDKVTQALADLPEFKSTAGKRLPSVNAKSGGGEAGSKQEQALADLRKAMGIKPKST
jgi:hypothetical protein